MAARPSYTLKHPIEREIKTSEGETRIEVIRTAGTVLEVRRTKGRDMEIINGISDKMKQTLVMLSRHTGLSEEDIRDMDAEDMGGLGELIGSFMPDAQA